MNDITAQDNPDLGIVLVALVGGEALRHCLGRIATMNLPCVVMLGKCDNGMSELKSDFPAVTFVEYDGQPVPLRRQRGAEMMSTRVVAFLEDSSLPDSGWEVAVREAFADGHTAAVGGPVRLADSLASPYLALGCGEYGRFHPQRFGRLACAARRDDGLTPVVRLPGNNLAYRRDLLRNILDQEPQGLIEGVVNERLVKQGYAVLMHPSMQVSYAFEDRHGARLATRFQHGRLFASNRVAGSSLLTRVTWAAKSGALPFLLTARGIASMRHAVKMVRWPLVSSWIFMMESSWALGEVTGYLWGAGRSIEAWT